MSDHKEQNAGDSWGEGLTPVERSSAQEATLAFLMAVKNYGLFPPDHISTINMLNALAATLGGFAERYGSLRITIEKNRLRYEDEAIFEEPNPDNNPAFIFFRDGLLWLEFLPGLQPWEVLAFFRIISRFKLTQEEPEGDLVTELWSADLAHVNHEAAENLWEAEPVLEFSLLNPDTQAVLEYGVAAQTAGFDLLKSVLGIAGAPKVEGGGPDVLDRASRCSHLGGGSGGKGKGGGMPEKAGAVGGAAEMAGPGGGVGEAVACSAGEIVLPSPGAVVAAESGRPGAAGAVQPGSPGVVGPGKSGPDEDMAGLDFWAALRRVSPSAQAIGGAPGTGRDGAGGGHGRSGAGGGGGVERSQVLSVPGEHPVAGEGGRAGGAGKGGRREAVADDPDQGFSRGPAAEVSTRKSTAFSRPGRGGDWEGGSRGEEKYISVNVASIEPGHSLWNFTPAEQQELRRMVRQHEDGDNSVDIIEVLLILLKMEDEPQIVQGIMAFLKEEFRLALSNRRFSGGHFLLIKVNELLGELPPQKEWMRPMLGQFFEEITEPEILEAMAPVWRELPSLVPEELQKFAAILRLLPPRAGVALMPLVPQIEAGMGRRILLDLIGAYAARDLGVVEKMLERPEEELILRLVHVLRENPERQRAEQLLLKVLKHPKENVRLEVCDILFARDTENFDKIFPLINDPSPAVRDAAFTYLGRERIQEVEALFLAHIASDRFLMEDQEHIARCYLALGLCGSNDALPLLKKVLFGQPWNFMAGIGTKVHRHGAAIALSKLRNRGSRELLAAAEASPVPHIRGAWQKAMGK